MVQHNISSPVGITAKHNVNKYAGFAKLFH